MKTLKESLINEAKDNQILSTIAENLVTILTQNHNSSDCENAFNDIADMFNNLAEDELYDLIDACRDTKSVGELFARSIGDAANEIVDNM